MSVDKQQIEVMLREELPECDIAVEGEGGKYRISVVGEVFADLGPVKRQQMVYRILNEHIASGAIHAVSMQLLTPDEAAAGTE